MEGLIKSIVDITLHGGGDERGSESPRPSPREERTRSTWAEVIPLSLSPSLSSSLPYSFSISISVRWFLLDLTTREGTRTQPWSSTTADKISKTRRMIKKEMITGRLLAAAAATNNITLQQTYKHAFFVNNLSSFRCLLQILSLGRRYPSSFFSHASIGSHLEPTGEDLSDLSKACNKLWELDSNRLVPGEDYLIDCGGAKRVHETGDVAPNSLFRWVRGDVFRRPTYSRFSALLDDYNPHEGYREVVTPEDKHEQAAFVEEINRTAVIKYLHRYLVSKNLVSDSQEEFKNLMSRLWFELYGRGGVSGSSSAFEHVFAGEIKGRGENGVSGFHNWIQFYLEEAKGKVDYKGYIFPRHHGHHPDSHTQLLTIQFEWNGVLKSISTTLVGVSPEFEIALYTLCFFVGGENNHVLLGPYPVNIKCYRFGNHKIGSVFPIAES